MEKQTKVPGEFVPQRLERGLGNIQCIRIEDPYWDESGVRGQT